MLRRQKQYVTSVLYASPTTAIRHLYELSYAYVRTLSGVNRARRYPAVFSVYGNMLHAECYVRVPGGGHYVAQIFIAMKARGARIFSFPHISTRAPPPSYSYLSFCLSHTHCNKMPVIESPNIYFTILAISKNTGVDACVRGRLSVLLLQRLRALAFQGQGGRGRVLLHSRRGRAQEAGVYARVVLSGRPGRDQSDARVSRRSQPRRDRQGGRRNHSRAGGDRLMRTRDRGANDLGHEHGTIEFGVYSYMGIGASTFYDSGDDSQWSGGVGELVDFKPSPLRSAGRADDRCMGTLPVASSQADKPFRLLAGCVDEEKQPPRRRLHRRRWRWIVPQKQRIAI